MNKPTLSLLLAVVPFHPSIHRHVSLPSTDGDAANKPGNPPLTRKWEYKFSVVIGPAELKALFVAGKVSQLLESYHQS